MIVADPYLCAALKAAGLDAIPLDDAPPDTLRSARALVLGGDDPWGRLRSLRVGGVRTGAVIVGSDPPDDRPRLEPVTSLRTPDPELLPSAVEGVERVRTAGSVRLPSGVADLDRSLFRRSDGAEARLTGLEARLLAYLASRAPRAVDRDELQREVWGYSRALATKTVEMTVTRLRKKIEPDPVHPVSILTVRGGGYRAVPAQPEPLRLAGPAGRCIGRDRDLAELRALPPGVVVALFGPPGVGKTRLGQELVAGWPGSARRVDLDGAAGTPLTSALATALGARPEGDPLTSIRAALVTLELLVVDHADDHAGEAALWPSLVEGATRIVLTARTAVRATSVRVREVAPLDEAAAVELLEDRAGAPLRTDDARPLVELLDRLPLAIELAAAPCAMLGPRGLRQALEAHGSVWLSGSGARHPSVESAVAWSWQRLDARQQQTLARLSVFRGAFRADDAAALGADLLALVELVGQSLVTRADGVPGGQGSGFRLLHAVRAHAERALPDAVRQVRPDVVRHFARQARALRRRLGGFDAADAYREATARVADLEQALGWATEPDDLCDLVGLLDRVRAAPPRERAEAIEAALRRSGHAPRARGRLLLMLGLVHSLRDPARALPAYEEARRLLADDPDGFADASRRLSFQLWWTVGPVPALAVLSEVPPESVDHRRRLVQDAQRWLLRSQLAEVSFERATDELEAIAEALVLEGALASAAAVAADFAHRAMVRTPGRALPLLVRFVAWYRAGHDDRAMSGLAVLLAGELAGLGRLDEAHVALDEAEARALRVDPARDPALLEQRATLFLRVGDHARARALLVDALRMRRSREVIQAEYGVLEQLVVLELDAGRPDRGLELARDLVDVAVRCDNPHLLNHGRLALATASIVAGAPRTEAAAVDPRFLSEFGLALYQHLRAALAAAGRDDPAALREIAPPPDAPWYAERLGHLAALALARNHEELTRATRPDREPNPDLRVAGRVWAACVA